MSMTPSVGVLGPEDWSYMAKVMSRKLDKAIEAKQLEADSFPKGVYYDAKKFFNLVRGALDYSNVIPENPSASIAAYAIASEVLKNLRTTIPLTLEELHQKLSKCADFVDSLEANRNIATEEELDTAQMISRFFEGLAEIGDNEIYLSRVGCFKDD